MKVFVAGGSGVIGRALVPQLIAAGHFVAATTRSKDKIEMVKSLGAAPVLLDALDADAVTAAVLEYRPDVVMNQLTSLPMHYNPRKLRPSYEATSRLKVDGTRILRGVGYIRSSRLDGNAESPCGPSHPPVTRGSGSSPAAAQTLACSAPSSSRPVYKPETATGASLT